MPHLSFLCMARFLRVELVTDEDTSIFLTRDGSESGLAVKIEIPNLEDLLRATLTVYDRSASGENVRQFFAEPGKDFNVNVLTWMAASVWDDIRAIKDTDISIIITENKSGVWTEIFNRNVSLIGLQGGNPVNGRIPKASMRFITI